MLQSARKVPLVRDVDIVVAGGSAGAVAAACAAAARGAEVCLIAPRTYLGEDLCGSLRFYTEDSGSPSTDLARRLFSDRPATPLHLKRTLDQALLEAGVEFLLGCSVTDLLVDGSGAPAGIVLADRCGRQAVRARVVIDATERAVVARLAGDEFTPYPEGVHRFSRYVVGGERQSGEGLSSRVLDCRVKDADGRSHPVIEYTLELPMPGCSWADFAEAEQAARDLTFHPAQVAASDNLFELPPDRVVARKALAGDWPGAEGADLDIFRPASTDNVWVLGACADMSREAARKSLTPDQHIAVGERIGSAAYEQAKGRPRSEDVKVAGGERLPADTQNADVREFLNGLRPVDEDLPGIRQPTSELPQLGEYDVVVAGGGTAGAPAAVSAVREGARTLVIEPLFALGGVGTVGLIGKYYHGYRGGFTKEIEQGVAALESNVYVQAKSEWYRREIRRAGGDIWFGTTACGAVVEDGRVKGVVVTTPVGRGFISARALVDATGNADVAAAAGAECLYVDDSSPALQGSGLPPVNLGKSYTNTDYSFADDGDMIDTWRMFVAGRQRFSEGYDFGQLLDTRERRRIVGDVVLTPLDHILHRTYSDTIMIGKSNFDSHGFTTHPYFLLDPPDREELTVDLPLRALLPRGLDNIIVTGLAASAHRDAMPIIRMQPDLQNQGYAVGMIAAAAAQRNDILRGLDLKPLQKALVEKECLPARVLSDTDSPPPSDTELNDAVDRVVNQWEGLALLLGDPGKALPLLRAAFAEASQDQHKLTYAHILGMTGDPSGAQFLASHVSSCEWDEGWNYRGMGQFGPSLSRLDSIIIALGKTRAPCALPVVLVKTRELTGDHAFSHHRAVAVALETIGDQAAAEPLALLLSKPGMTGHDITKQTIRREFEDADPVSNLPRTQSLRELVLARALYRCGDHEGLGEKILRRYEQDLRGLYARHAHAVLKHSPAATSRNLQL